MALRNEEIGRRLVALRELRGNPPQEAVAADMGVSYRSYQAWEGGQTKPSWRNLTRLAEYYGVTPEWILIGDDEVPEPEDRLSRIEAQLSEVLERLASLTRDAGDVDPEMARKAAGRRVPRPRPGGQQRSA